MAGVLRARDSRELSLAVAFALAFTCALVVAGCTRSGAPAARAMPYRGPAVLTGDGDLAACPGQFNFDQYRNDMMNLQVDPGDPGYAVARDFDLRNRRCIELKKGERVLIEGGDRADSRVRPFGESQTYWTSAGWTSRAESGASAGNGQESRSPQR